MRRTAIVSMAIAIMTFMVLPAHGEEKLLQIKGSDTIVNLVQKMADVYSEKNPGTQVSVNGGGSGTGLAGLRNRTADIADSSRPIRQREVVDMKAKGINPVSIIIGIDCITLVVNEKNKVDKLTFRQLGAIFRGEITNWKEVGGDDTPISLYGRQSNSGTYEVFKETVINGEYADTMKRMNGNAQIVEGIKYDLSGLGYVGLGFAKNASGLKVVKIAAGDGAEYIDPDNRSDVESGRYSLTRPLYQYTDGVPTGAIMNFIKFELSPEGQKIVEEMGFIPITNNYVEENKRNAGI